MFGLSASLVPFLLASSPGIRTTIPTTTSSSSYQGISDRFESLYRDLAEGASVVQRASPTLQFCLVPPPTADNATWRRPVDLRNTTDHSQQEELLFHKVADTFGNDKPLALLLPGLDGYGISAHQQFDDLADTFELWRMTISPHDRLSFFELTQTVADFVFELSNAHVNRNITLIGESFGGLLAPAVALQVQARCSRNKDKSTAARPQKNPLQGLVLVNPATSFDETAWSALGPFLASLRYLPKVSFLPSPYSVLGGLTLSALVPDSTQLQQMLSLILGTQSNVQGTEDLLTGMTRGFQFLEDFLPPATIEHRVAQWLPVGAQFTRTRLASLAATTTTTTATRTLVVAGQEDKFLPSRREAERLKATLMPHCETLLVKGSGHFVLDERVNLTDAIVYSHIDPLQQQQSEKEETKKYDAILDWELPPEHVVRRVIDRRVQPLRRLASPAFFSTDSSGKRYKGLSKVPSSSQGPIVFVSNHQLLGLDLGMIIAELLEQRGIVARGLGHPVLFQQGMSDAASNQPRTGSSTPGIRNAHNDDDDDDNNNVQVDSQLFQQFGAVMVTPRNYYRLLQTGQNALLFPGGVREVFHGKDEAYQLFWPETTDFVRTAARFNATVVPISAVGAADSLNVLVDAPDMANLPFGLGERVLRGSANVTAARFDMDDESELFTPPLVVPSKPARHYFVFGKPMSTAAIDHMDPAACQTFYTNVQKEMNRGFDDVLRAREKDPFLDPLRRLAYEQVTGKQAPTFSMSELHHE